jgi:hypothetical protein
MPPMTYSWNQRSASGAATATFSIVIDEVVERQNGMPAVAAPTAISASAPGCASPCAAIGAIATGSAERRPTNEPPRSIDSISRRTRGTKR